MIDLDRASLERVLPATAGAPDWDEVLGRSHADVRRRKLITLAVAVLTAVVATASAFAVHAIVFDGGGVTALPPRGTKPSTPATGRTALHFWGRARGAAVIQVWVYADGRIVRRQFPGLAGVDGIRTGFIERRLTREGVALLRSKIRATIVATGLAGDHVLTHWTLDFGLVRVWNGIHVASVEWACGPPFCGKPAKAVATDEQRAAIARLLDLILDPAAALPGHAWEDRTPRAYVASRYAVCFMRARKLDYFLPPRRVMPLLPAVARDLLRGRTRAFSSFGVRSQCSDLTLEDARALYVILSEVGFERDPFAGGKTRFMDAVFNNVRFRAPSPNRTLFIAFEPILPHGQWELMPG